MVHPNTVLLQGQLPDLEAIAYKLIHHAGTQKVWLFDGEMGVGKTTLIKLLCRQLGVTDIVTSPTFSLVNEYISLTGEKVYHFDCYRINSERERLRIDFESYFDTGSYCFIEWPSKMGPVVPDTYFYIEIEQHIDGSRSICGKLLVR